MDTRELVRANEIVASFMGRFTWEADGRLDSYHILPSEGAVSGDCDDAAVTVLLEYCNRSYIRFWWMLASRRAKLFLVNSPNGEKHLVLYISGIGYTDNWKDEFTPTIAPHTTPYKYWPWPVRIPAWLVALKLFIGLFDRT